MVDVIQSATFRKWIADLRDTRATFRIRARIDRLIAGNPGDVRAVGGSICEMRIDYGPGYRVYYLSRGPLLVILLCGGDKATQQRDIERARQIAADWQD